MKLKDLIIGLVLIILIGCSKKAQVEDIQKEIIHKLVKTEYKGCFINNPVDTNKSLLYETGDSLYYTVENDTLLLHVIMNYNCCGLLNDSLVIDDENVNIYIRDTCTYACICYCLCDFEFEYSFINFLGNNIHFYVYLKGYEEDVYSLWGDLIYP